MLFIIEALMADWERGIIDCKYKKEFAFMVNFYRLNTSLLLLNYAGSRNEAKSYYKQLNSGRIASLSSRSLLSMILKLPFVWFAILLTPIYHVYKFINK